ncbi:MAG: AEC family transporter [Halobacteriota archaeon]
MEEKTVIFSLGTFLPVYQFVMVTFLVVGVVRFLHWRGIFTDADQPIFDRLVTELALPAIIFSMVATSTVPPEMVVPIIILFAGLITALCIAWAICWALHLSPKTTGTLVMASGFGSTATMAIPIITETFPTVTQAYEHAVVIGTFGVALPFFTIGVLISSYFGTYDESGHGHIIRVLKEFLTTPVFIAFILGCLISILLSSFQIPGAAVFTDVFAKFFTIIYQSVQLLIWISIGLLLRPIRARYLLPFLVLTAGIKLIIEPALVIGYAQVADVSYVTSQILLFEAAIPSGALAAVMASRYGCNGELAGWLVMGTYLLCLVTVPFVFFIFT